MKQFFLTVSLATVVTVASAADALYLNEGTVNTPPVIDATNFVNSGEFAFTSGNLYDFFSVRNFTNHNVMANGFFGQTNSIFLSGRTLLGLSGFRFETTPPSLGGSYPAASFYNAPLTENPAANARIYADYQLLVSATNIVNRGLLSVSEFGLIKLDGRNVDASRGMMSVAAPSSSIGIFDRHWFFGTNDLRPEQNFQLNFPNTPVYTVIEFPGFTNSRLMNFFPLGADAGVTSAEFIYQAGNLQTVQIVFVRNLNTNIAVQIRSQGGSALQFGQPIVEWSAVDTNAAGQLITNALYLTDSYALDATNVYVTNFNQAPIRSLQPRNFTLTRAAPFGFQFANPGDTPFTDKPGTFWSAAGSPVVVTGAQYAAYGALVSATANASQSITNVRNSYGRVELTGSRNLDLNLSRVDAFSYLKLSATNHFSGASNAIISTPYADVALGSTNGTMNFTSLVKSTIPRFSGTVDAYSAVWTNDVFFNGATNTVRFNVLMVDSSLTNTSPVQIFDLSLRSTNLIVGDFLNILNSLSLDTHRLTITSNAGFNVSLSSVQWRDSAPNLRALTNFGTITFPNALNLVGRTTNNLDRPYESLVNHGFIQGTTVSARATNIYNDGTILSGVGPLVLQAATNITLPPGGLLSAAVSDVTLNARNLTVSNHTFVVGRTLNLNITNQLIAGTNDWQVFNGLTFPVRPTNSDLSHVALRSKAAQSQSASHQWPGADRGLSVAGYSNNAALGVLVLDGALNSQFVFTGNGAASNALYVDRLDLLNGAAQIDAQGNLAQLSINPGLTIYYAQATMNGGSAAEFMDGKNGGRLRWISSYAGPYSGTNVVYPDGSTNFLNAALVTSCNLDSDGDGIPNCIDPTPVVIAQFVPVALRVVSAPSPGLVLSWPTVSGATNRIYSAPSPSPATWQLVTNLISPVLPVPMFTNQHQVPFGAGSQFYRVKVEPPSPK